MPVTRKSARVMANEPGQVAGGKDASTLTPCSKGLKERSQHQEVFKHLKKRQKQMGDELALVNKCFEAMASMESENLMLTRVNDEYEKVLKASEASSDTDMPGDRKFWMNSARELAVHFKALLYQRDQLLLKVRQRQQKDTNVETGTN